MLSTDPTSTELAAWVQAVGSIVAIIAATLIAVFQSRSQYRSALRLQKKEHDRQRYELGRTIHSLAINCRRVMAYVTLQMRNREGVHQVATGELFLDIGELRRLDVSLAAVPLHGLSGLLVTPTMELSSLVRQLLLRIDATLQNHRQMNSNDFDKFFSFVRVVEANLESTIRKIDEVLEYEG